MPLRWRVRHWLAEHLPRWLAVFLAIRRLSPGLGERLPAYTTLVQAPDTGGGYRAKHRRQDPSVDPSEPYGSESSSTGNDHGWSGCTMSSGADAIAYQQPRGAVTPWGGDLRHRGGTDLSGGTDLYDLRSSWAALGETLTIRTGSGWSALAAAHDEGRAIVVQGEGNVPGSQTFDGGHACCIAPETHSDGRWLFGDPLASDWQWVNPSDIHAWMDRMSSGLYYATGEKPPPPPSPTPEPPPAPVPTYDQGYSEGYRVGNAAGEAHGQLVGAAEHADLVFRSWHPGGPFDPELVGALWGLSVWQGEGEPPEISEPWAAWPLPVESVWRAQRPAAWGTASWAGAVWRA